MKLRLDLHGFGYALKLGVLVAAILLAGRMIARQVAPRVAPPAFVDLPVSSFTETFYLEPPSEKPVFLTRRDALRKQDTLAWEGKDFLFVDLDSMRIRLYERGDLKQTFPIVRQAAEDSFFDPPSGLYQVLGKTESHASRIINARFPWTLYLYGNYLIHGAPAATRTGKIADATAPGGGIQLLPKDARELFAVTQPGMPVLVARERPNPLIRFAYFRQTNLPHSVPEVQAAAVLVVDLETGEVLFEKNPNDPYPTASVTKLMTALIAREALAGTTTLTVTPEALATYGDSAGLSSQEEFRVDDLYYGLLLPSSNDIATMFELVIPNLLDRMNRKAAELEMTKTVFDDPSGLSQENVTSASDILKLLNFIYHNDPQLLEITHTPRYVVISELKKRRHVWTNINWPHGDKRFLGGKAGWTDDALQTMAGVYLVRLTESGSRPIAVIVLGARERIPGIRSIIAYLEQNFIYGATVAGGGRKPVRNASGAAIWEVFDK